MFKVSVWFGIFAFVELEKKKKKKCFCVNSPFLELCCSCFVRAPINQLFRLGGGEGKGENNDEIQKNKRLERL